MIDFTNKNGPLSEGPSLLVTRRVFEIQGVNGQSAMPDCSR